MRILGIDPGLCLTGYGCVELSPGAAEPALVEAGVLRLNVRKPVAYRLAQLFADLSEVIDDASPQRLVVEKLFSHYKHATTSVQMGHARGVILLAGEQAGLGIEELAATEVKKAVTGHGHASKQQVQMAVMGQLGLPEPPTPFDVADAIAIALCAARRIALSEVRAIGA